MRRDLDKEAPPRHIDNREPKGLSWASAMRDLAFVGFLALMFLFGFKRPFLFVLTYAYIDIVAPQRLTYLLLNSVPISLIAVMLAVLGWLVADDKGDSRALRRDRRLIFLLLHLLRHHHHHG
jgi:hypothetical protein